MTLEHTPQYPESQVAYAQDTIVQNINEYGSVRAYLGAVLNELIHEPEDKEDLQLTRTCVDYVVAGTEDALDANYDEAFCGALLAVSYLRSITIGDLQPGKILKAALDAHAEETRRESYKDVPSRLQDKVHAKTALRLQFENSTLNRGALDPRHELLLERLVAMKQERLFERYGADGTLKDDDYPHQFGIGFRFVVGEVLRSDVTLAEQALPRETIPEGTLDELFGLDSETPTSSYESIEDAQKKIAVKLMRMRAQDNPLDTDTPEKLLASQRAHETSLASFIEEEELFSHGEPLVFEGNMHAGIRSKDNPTLHFMPLNKEHSLQGFYEGIAVVEAPTNETNKAAHRHKPDTDPNDPKNQSLFVPCIVLSLATITNHSLTGGAEAYATTTIPDEAQICIPLIYADTSGYRETLML